MALKTLTDWMGFLSAEERVHREDDLVVHVYGEGDNSYIVVEKVLSRLPSIIEQYTFHSVGETNPLFSFFCFLNECDFDLNSLISTIIKADYLEESMNEVARFEDVEVARYEIRPTTSNM